MFADAYADAVSTNGGKTPKGVWEQVGNGRHLSQSEKRAIRDFIRNADNGYPAEVQPKLRNQKGKPGNTDHEDVVGQLKQLAASEFPDDVIVTGKNIKHQPGKAYGLSFEPDVWVMDSVTKHVLKAYEAARIESDGKTLKKREMDKKVMYAARGIPSHFEPVI